VTEDQERQLAQLRATIEAQPLWDRLVPVVALLPFPSLVFGWEIRPAAGLLPAMYRLSLGIVELQWVGRWP
jgi:hypothetical protein